MNETKRQHTFLFSMIIYLQLCSYNEFDDLLPFCKNYMSHKHIHLFCYTRQLLLHRNLSIWLWMRNLQRIILRGICISMYILYTCIIRFYCFFAVMREIECHAPSIRSHLHFYMNIRYRVKGVKNDWFTKQFRLFCSLIHYAWNY